jgi:uncharacterized phage infection (PIP) family protein YhgE
MKISSVIKEGYDGIFKNKFKIIVIVAMVIIAMLFGLLSVKAFWHPDERLSEIAVPIVNLDSGEKPSGLSRALKNRVFKSQRYGILF